MAPDILAIYRDGFSAREISSITHIPTSTVSDRIRAAGILRDRSSAQIVKGQRATVSQQQAGCVWQFRCGHNGTLPQVNGETNEFATWQNKRRTIRKGYWLCRLCLNVARQNGRHGLGKTGLLGRVKFLLRQAKCTAKLNGYAAPNITATQIVDLWYTQQGRCAACHQPIDVLKKRGAALDHDHDTGLVRAFLCPPCNTAEAILRRYTKKQREGLLAYVQRYSSETAV